MDSDQPDHRPSSTPLFRAIPTGTYTRRNFDARRMARIEAPSSNNNSISQGQDKILGSRKEIKTDVAPIQPLPSTAWGWQDDDESLESQERTAETADPILYRETTAVANGSMTLLSKQPSIEAPQTGAKGRAREREARRFAVARIMPSQGLIAAAKGLSRREGRGRTVLYSPLTADGYLVGEMLEEEEGIEARVRNPEEVLLVGCGAAYDRRSRERGFSPASSSLYSNTEKLFIIDGKGVAEDEARQFLALHPDGKSWGTNSEIIRRERERSRLFNENALLKREVARLEEAAARHREEETLRDENENLRTELQRLKTEADARKINEEPAIARTFSGGLAENETLWKDAGLGNQPRRSANRGNRVGASLMSQEVMIEHPSAGKGRAREREERRRLQNLAREPRRSYSDSDSDREWHTRRRANWRPRPLPDSEDESKAPLQDDNNSSSIGNLRNRKAEIAAAISHLPPDVLVKYGPNRPPRIWREHSHEILVEAANGGGSRGKRREAEEKRERETGEGGEAERETPRFRPPRGLVQAMKAGVLHRTENEDDSVAFDWVPKKFEARTRDAMLVHDSLDPDSGDEEEFVRGRSPDEALAKYAADRPSRMFRDGSCEVLLEGDAAGRRRRVERAYRRQLPEPRFMPSQAMADEAAKMGRGENACLDDDKEEDENNKRKGNDSADEQ